MDQDQDLLPYDESYVLEILADVPRGLDRRQFQSHCIRDIHGGWKLEVNEAARRYFGDPA